MYTKIKSRQFEKVQKNNKGKLDFEKNDDKLIGYPKHRENEIHPFHFLGSIGLTRLDFRQWNGNEETQLSQFKRQKYGHYSDANESA